MALSEKNCTVCGLPLTPEEDTVVCPLCAAPYHRACWPQEGCRFADKHGTGWRWRLPPRRRDEEACVCGNCGRVFPEGTVRCDHCGESLTPKTPEALPPDIDPSVFYADFSPFIGLAPDSRLDGNTALDIVLFVGPRAGYYLSRFYRLSLGHSAFSWNWAALLFPLEWALARRQNKLFWSLFAAWLPAALAGVAALCWVMPQLDMEALFALLTGSHWGSLSFYPWLLWQVSAFWRWCLRLYMATRANHHYRRYTALAVRSVPEDAPDRRQRLRKAGGLAPYAVGWLYGACAVISAVGLVIWGNM